MVHQEWVAQQLRHAALLNNHGLSVLKQMSKYYPAVEELIDEARFRAGVVWLQWGLIGLQYDSKKLLLAHIGNSAFLFSAYWYIMVKTLFQEFANCILCGVAIIYDRRSPIPDAVMQIDIFI